MEDDENSWWPLIILFGAPVVFIAWYSRPWKEKSYVFSGLGRTPTPKERVMMAWQWLLDNNVTDPLLIQIQAALNAGNWVKAGQIIESADRIFKLPDGSDFTDVIKGWNKDK